MNRDTKRYYDLTAERVADEWYANDVLMPSIREFVAFLPEKPLILDLGCGPGYESMRLVSVGAEVVGVDFSAECIRVARERCPQSRFEVMDFRELNDRLGKFHGVFASGSLIHIGPDELPTVLGRVADVLLGGGYLLAMVQDGEGLRESLRVVNGEKLRRVMYLHSRMSLASAARRFSLVKEGFLSPELHERGWRSYLLQAVEQPGE